MAEIDTKNLNDTVKNIYEIDNNAFSCVEKEDPKDKINVEVGDSKQPDTFYPQVKLMRWDNEVNFSARLVTDTSDIESISSVQDVISWEKGKISAGFYPLDPSPNLPEGGYEFDIHISEKPTTNVITFTIRTKGLIFYYQPAFTELKVFDNPNAVSCDECNEYDRNGNVVSHRSEDTIHSYAVYYKDHPPNLADEEGNTVGKEYRNGKAFHIHRPKIIDADGNWCWGELNIDTDGMLMTVTIPQEFLDKAVYPIRHAAGATFGYESVGGSTSSIAADNFRGSLQTSPEDANYATLQSLRLYAASVTTSRNVKGVTVLHSNLTIITNGVTNATSVSTTAGWKILTYGTDPTILASTGYLLGFIPETSSVNIYYDVGATNQFHYDTTNSYSSPTNPTDASSNNNEHSEYAVYTTVAAATISVSDTPTATDTPTVEISGPSTTSVSINVNDSSAVTDVPTVSIPTLHISVSDVPTATDIPTVRKNSENVSVYDSSAVTDVVSGIKIPILHISVSDTPTASDTVSSIRLGSNNISCFDTPTATDTPTVKIPILHVSVSDTSTVTDVPSVRKNSENISVFDTVTITENTTITMASTSSVSVSLYDTPVATDVSTVTIPTLHISVSDSPSTTDVLIIQTTHFISKFDSSAVTDASTVVIPTLHISKFEIPTVTDVPTVTIPTLHISSSDTPTVTEDSTILKVDPASLSISTSDSPVVTEVPTLTIPILHISVSDAPVVTEFLSASTDFFEINKYDSTTVTDSISMFVRNFEVAEPNFTLLIDVLEGQEYYFNADLAQRQADNGWTGLNTFTGQTVFQPLVDSDSVVVINNAEGAPVFQIDTVNNWVIVGDVDLTDHDPNVPFYIVRTSNSYVAFNMANLSDGETASADIGAVNDLFNFIDAGITSSGNIDPLYPILQGGRAYLWSSGSDLVLGSGAAGTDLILFAGGFELTNELLRLSGDGEVGFYGHAPVALQTGVEVTASGIHAALVALGLITA